MGDERRFRVPRPTAQQILAGGELIAELLVQPEDIAPVQPDRKPVTLGRGRPGIFIADIGPEGSSFGHPQRQVGIPDFIGLAVNQVDAAERIARQEIQILDQPLLLDPAATFNPHAVADLVGIEIFGAGRQRRLAINQLHAAHINRTDAEFADRDQHHTGLARIQLRRRNADIDQRMPLCPIIINDIARKALKVTQRDRLADHLLRHRPEIAIVDHIKINAVLADFQPDDIDTLGQLGFIAAKKFAPRNEDQTTQTIADRGRILLDCLRRWLIYRRLLGGQFARRALPEILRERHGTGEHNACRS